jgi:hypothetical protein
VSRELAAAQEHVARLELDQALAGFNSAKEAQLGRSAPSAAGQSPLNAEKIAAAMRSADAAQRSSEARERQNAPSHEEAVRLLQAGQAPDNLQMIRASTTTVGIPAGAIPGPAR